MNERNEFPYITGEESQRFSYVRLPVEVMLAERFQDLSLKAAVAYSYLLNLTALSIQNHWIDEEGHVFVMCNQEKLGALLRCERKAVQKVLAELDEDSGIGLIKRKRQGQGRPDIIYVKNFEKGCPGSDGTKEEISNSGTETAAGTGSEVLKGDIRDGGTDAAGGTAGSDWTKRDIRNRGTAVHLDAGNPQICSDASKRDIKKSEKGTSGCVEKGHQEVPKRDTNKKEIIENNNITLEYTDDNGERYVCYESDPVSLLQREIGNGISERDAAAILKAADGDICRVRRAYDLLLQSHPDRIGNPVGWLIAAIRDSYEEPVQWEAVDRSNSSWSYINGHDYDFAAIELKKRGK